MTLAIAFGVCVLAQVALSTAHVWWVLASCQPLVLFVVAAARRHAPTPAAWWGLAAGMCADLAAGRFLGPGAIAGAAAAAVVAFTLRRFELEGPLTWVLGSLIATAVSETVLAMLLFTLGARPDHRWVGAAAALATTGIAGLIVALGERLVRTWRSPGRQRRRVLKRL